MYSISILMTCFNRADKTKACLETIYSQQLNDVELAVFLVDDGSSDGTAELIACEFPSVNVIKGSGNLYWNGGMRLAWQVAIEHGDADFYLWLNDDCIIYNNSIKKILADYQSLNYGYGSGIIVGTMQDPETGVVTYGGRCKKSRVNSLSLSSVLPPNGELQECDFINGNFTLIPREVVGKIGILSEAFTHSMGDFDYGLRAKKVGFKCWVSTDFLGACPANSAEGGYLDGKLNFKDRLKKMQQITQLPPPDEWMFFVSVHGGKFRYLYYLKVLFRKYLPMLWLYLVSRKFS